MNIFTVPLQRDADYLQLALWRARVWLNNGRRAAAKPNGGIPPFLQRKRKGTNA